MYNLSSLDVLLFLQMARKDKPKQYSVQDLDLKQRIAQLEKTKSQIAPPKGLIEKVLHFFAMRRIEREIKAAKTLQELGAVQAGKIKDNQDR